MPGATDLLVILTVPSGVGVAANEKLAGSKQIPKKTNLRHMPFIVFSHFKLRIQLTHVPKNSAAAEPRARIVRNYLNRQPDDIGLWSNKHNVSWASDLVLNEG